MEQNTQKEKWLFSLTISNIGLILVGVILNLAGRWLTEMISMPLWLDCIGTFLSAVVLGPLAGAISGFFTNVLLSFWMKGQIWFAIVNIAGGIAVGRLFPRNRKITSFSVIATSIYAAFIMVVISTPLNLYFNHGYIGNEWGDALIDMLSPYISVSLIKCFLGELFINVPDKALSIIIVMFVLILWKRRGNLPKESTGEIRTGLFPFFLILVVAGLAVPSAPAFAASDFNADYIASTYGEEDGLASAEINTIAQTKDGYIWVGSYSGLYRYDGLKFTQMHLDERISNVTYLYEDSNGNLWIGTNDSGVFRYNPDDGNINLFSKAEGLSANSIRSICEGKDGEIYISTTGELCRIDTKGNIFIYDKLSQITCVYNLNYLGDEQVSGVTRNGLFFILKGDDLLLTKEYDKNSDETNALSYTSAAYNGDGIFLVGTTGDVLERLQFDGTTLKSLDIIKTDQISMANFILYNKQEDGFFVAADSGFGFIDQTGKVNILTKDGFSNAISHTMTDYQNNIWFVSTKQGVLKLSSNPFMDIFRKAKISSDAVNATLLDENTLYIGTDNGVSVVDIRNYTLTENRFSAALKKIDGERVRHLMKDSTGSLWVSTYGEMGLLKISPNGDFVSYNSNTPNILGNRFRFTLELSNKDIAAFSTDGINLIHNGTITDTFGEEDGLTVPQILAAAEKEDGSLLVGSDGDGIYQIKNGKLVKHISEKEGLKGLVVLRIVSCDEGDFYVTGNGIYFDDQKGKVKKLENFPYSNNYDIYIDEEELAWVSGSAGIYVTPLKDMIKDKKYRYVLLNHKWGLDTTLTANAWNTVSGNDFYLCCTDGVRKLNTKNYQNFNDNYQIVINSFLHNEKKNVTIKKGAYQVPSGSGTLQIAPSVLNYTMSDPLVSVSIKGLKKKEIKKHQSELSAIFLTDLPYGNYTLHVKVLNEITGATLKESSFAIHKDARLYEHTYYKIYLAFVCVMLIAFIAWMVAEMSNMAVINRQYDQIREAKEEAEYANQAKSRFLANMSHEIRTPINAVLGMDEMILRESTEPDIRGYAADIFTAGNTLLSLINDILDSSKIESGKMEIVPIEYKLSTLIRDLVNMIQGRAQAKDLLLEVEVEETLPVKLFGDDVRIRQVITNILTNAVKYTPSGTVWFRVKGQREGEEEVLHFEVEDTGIGIKEEDMPKLFEEFQRIEESRNRNIEGTGLGMNITIQLLQLMGSRLQVESVYGKGSTFFFDIRQKIIDETQIGDFNEMLKHAADNYSYEGGFQAPEAKVLVVDDNATNRKVFKSLLKITKIQVTEAGSGQESLDLVNDHDFDMIFMDHMMPDMDGVETMQHMRKMDKLKDTPIYVLTANAVTGAKEQYLEMGFDGFISKPIVSEKLETALKEELPTELIKPLDPEDMTTKPENKTAFSTDDYPVIDGLDWAYAQMHLPEEELLISTVEDFYEMLYSQADKLQGMYEALQAENSEENMTAYRIHVHAMKSVAATIGIVPLAGMAKILEYAAREEDFTTIRSLHDTFIKEWKSYREKLTGVFGIGETNTNKDMADKSMLLAIFSMLRPAMDDFDLDTVDELVEKLKAYSYPDEAEKLLPELIAAVKEMDMEEAEKYMQEMEQKM